MWSAAWLDEPGRGVLSRRGLITLGVAVASDSMSDLSQQEIAAAYAQHAAAPSVPVIDDDARTSRTDGEGDGDEKAKESVDPLQKSKTAEYVILDYLLRIN